MFSPKSSVHGPGRHESSRGPSEEIRLEECGCEPDCTCSLHPGNRRPSPAEQQVQPGGRSGGFPLIPAVIHSIARRCYYNDKCWVSSDTSLLYIIHGPICAALVVNLFFLLNIVRVLITKLRVTHQAESSLYMRAVRATLILIPLLGIQFVLLPYKPQEQHVAEVYLYVMEILMHYQGLLVSTIFCFFNGEVRSQKTSYAGHWSQQRMQLAGTFANADFFRSASYVASSLTEVHRCYSIESHTETINGKSYSDIFRSDSPFV
uniref:G-protein coupled receptors family 2 profile 2 domain-containing protein n=1 Tax=Knipowitschia caucasica TaxID=637954 RepID=A0AAV2L992_KNICA